MVNLSVWETLDALTDFVYEPPHREVMVQRRKWFERMGEVYLAVWWVPAGRVPTVAEASARLERIRVEGPTAAAFTFKHVFGVPTTADAS